jgi:putative Ca2+/H+ antiporter (TMEM165/GDT1 family)
MYAIMESRYRWTILAGIAFGLAVVGAMAMLMHQWSHIFVKVWFYVGLAATVYFMVRAFVDWKTEVEANLEDQQPR